MSTDLLGPTLDDAIREVARELALRRRVYPKWCAAGRMKQHQADWQIACLEAALERLEAQR